MRARPHAHLLFLRSAVEQYNTALTGVPTWPVATRAGLPRSSRSWSGHSLEQIVVRALYLVPPCGCRGGCFVRSLRQLLGRFHFFPQRPCCWTQGSGGSRCENGTGTTYIFQRVTPPCKFITTPICIYSNRSHRKVVRALIFGYQRPKNKFFTHTKGGCGTQQSSWKGLLL
jgi:hypothetical protein